jgi:hypothetical protein
MHTLFRYVDCSETSHLAQMLRFAQDDEVGPPPVMLSVAKHLNIQKSMIDNFTKNLLTIIQNSDQLPMAFVG